MEFGENVTEEDSNDKRNVLNLFYFSFQCSVYNQFWSLEGRT